MAHDHARQSSTLQLEYQSRAPGRRTAPKNAVTYSLLSTYSIPRNCVLEKVRELGTFRRMPKLLPFRQPNAYGCNNFRQIVWAWPTRLTNHEVHPRSRCATTNVSRPRDGAPCYAHAARGTQRLNSSGNLRLFEAVAGCSPSIAWRIIWMCPTEMIRAWNCGPPIAACNVRGHPYTSEKC